MSDLISRQAVLEEIRKIECEPGYQHVGEDWAVGLIIAENIVESAESIESTSSAEPEIITIEEVSNQLGCATIQSALYWFEFLKTLDLLGFAIVRKEAR